MALDACSNFRRCLAEINDVHIVGDFALFKALAKFCKHNGRHFADWVNRDIDVARSTGGSDHGSAEQVDANVVLPENLARDLSNPLQGPGADRQELRLTHWTEA